MRRVICDIINSDETFQAIDTCRDGLDALEKLRAKRYDGVVLDVNMPVSYTHLLVTKASKEADFSNILVSQLFGIPKVLYIVGTTLAVLGIATPL